MKKLLILLGFITVFAGCKYNDLEYTIIREFGPGTYTTLFGAAKYFSGSKDSVTTIRDIYAIVQEKVLYNNVKDSVLAYGHCWSKNPNKIRVVDTLSTCFTYDGLQETMPSEFTDFVTEVPDNSLFESVMTKLVPVTNYYVKSYVITGKLDGTNLDTAYNPVATQLKTLQTKDKWEPRTEFTEQYFKGGVSFVYKNELYAGMGANAEGPTKTIFKYDTESNSWASATNFPGLPTSDAVAFVLEDIDVNGIKKDFIYIGTGYTLSGGVETVTREFYRWEPNLNPPAGTWTRLINQSAFIGTEIRNAIAFSINGKGYVGLGQGTTTAVMEDFYQFDPQKTDGAHPYGTWRAMTSYPDTDGLTKAVSFVIDKYAYVTGGVDQNGAYQNRLWKFQPPLTSNDDDDGVWIQKQSFPGTARIDAVGFAIENFGYIGTGFDGDSLRSDFWRYNPYINQWEERARFIGLPRKEAIGAGLYYEKDDEYRGYIGTGVIDDTFNPYTNTFYHYLP